ncbi:MAG: transcriptional regulator, partial [Nocardioides sp.]
MNDPARIPLADVDLAERVPAWIDWTEASRLLGVTIAKVRTMIRDHELAAAVPAPKAGQQIP